ncbi:MAG: hypothetical protein V1723_03740 [Candidatus Uhrbacteria bacterium]
MGRKDATRDNRRLRIVGTHDPYVAAFDLDQTVGTLVRTFTTIADETIEQPIAASAIDDPGLQNYVRTITGGIRTLLTALAQGHDQAEQALRGLLADLVNRAQPPDTCIRELRKSAATTERNEIATVVRDDLRSRAIDLIDKVVEYVAERWLMIAQHADSAERGLARLDNLRVQHAKNAQTITDLTDRCRKGVHTIVGLEREITRLLAKTAITLSDAQYCPAEVDRIGLALQTDCSRLDQLIRQSAIIGREFHDAIRKIEESGRLAQREKNAIERLRIALTDIGVTDLDFLTGRDTAADQETIERAQLLHLGDEERAQRLTLPAIMLPNVEREFKPYTDRLSAIHERAVALAARTRSDDDPEIDAASISLPQFSTDPTEDARCASLVRGTLVATAQLGLDAPPTLGAVLERLVAERHIANVDEGDDVYLALLECRRHWIAAGPGQALCALVEGDGGAPVLALRIKLTQTGRSVVAYWRRIERKTVVG